MSSRSLAAARARRAGENAPPVSGNRPVTSIGSQAAFVQPGYQTNMPQQPPNVRVVRGNQPPPQNNAYQQVQQSQQQSKNSLPFSKLSISDAIGLITLRLGRVEQWVIETDHENETNQMSSDNGNSTDNTSVLTSIINRLNTIETREPGGNNNELSSKISDLTEQFTRMADEGVKHNLAISKHTEQLFRFERELVETKDILKTFMIKYDLFADETNNRFNDFEYALSDLEKAVVVPEEAILNENANANENANENGTEIILNDDLKNIIKQEFASSIE